MKKIICTLFVFVILLSCSKQIKDQKALEKTVPKTTQFKNQYDGKRWVDNEVLVQWNTKDEKSMRLMGASVKRTIFTKAMRNFHSTPVDILNVVDVQAAIDILKKNLNVKSVSPNWIVTKQDYPNDSLYLTNDLWGMKDIGAATAWATNIGSQKIYVADIDEGAAYYHPDLGPNLDVPHSYDFLHHDSTIFDFADHHGTHTAGTIGGAGNNSIGVIGVCPQVTIVQEKFLEGSGPLSAAIEAIDYSIMLKVDSGFHFVAMSNSWGYQGDSTVALSDAINRARLADILFVCAAGNNNSNNDIINFYPANHKIDNVISVGAKDISGNKASFSNYGLSVHLFAPGVNVWSTGYDGSANPIYVAFSGTSMATPHVAGACALYASGHQSAHYSEIKAAILNSTRKEQAFQGKCLTGGTLDVSTFTQGNNDVYTPRPILPRPFVDFTPPPAVANLRTTNITDNFISIAWDSVSDPESGIYFYGIIIKQSGIEYQQISTFYRFLNEGGLSPGVEYSFTVYQINKQGLVSPGTEIKVTTTGTKDVIAPTKVVVTITAIKPTEIDYDWTDATDNVKVSAYQIEGLNVAGNWGFGGTWVASDYPAGGLLHNDTYWFHVRAFDPAGNYAQWSDTVWATTGDTTFIPPPPPPPTDTVINSFSGINKMLSWQVTPAGAVEIQRSQKRNEGFSTIITVSATSYQILIKPKKWYRIKYGTKISQAIQL